MPTLVLSKAQYAFFDFDNTITPYDVLDDIIEKFCQSQKCQQYEILWQKGEISSAECLRVQLGLIEAKKEEIEEYLAQVRIDPDFRKLLFLFKEYGIKVVILSDSVHFLIETILKNNGVGEIDIYANRLEFAPASLKACFPHASEKCSMCGHCKKETLQKLKAGSGAIFAGDGRYDVCAALAADFIFAKGDLAQELRKKEALFYEFSSLADICSFFLPAYKKLSV